MAKFFPNKIDYEKKPGGDGEYKLHGGATIRDMMAMAIIQGMIAHHGIVKLNLDNPEMVWDLADKIVDAR
jgi:hypothetical protein